MSRNRILLLAGGVALVGLVLLLIMRGRGGNDGTAHKTAATPDAGAAAKPTPRPEPPTGESEGPPPGAELAYDDDPIGGLRLEGLVLDDEDRPVKGALVAISSNPSREVKSGDDGSFAFDKLLAREYTVEARLDDAVGGPVTARVHDKVEPVIIRLRRGASLELTVKDGATMKEIAGADVKLAGILEQSATTDTAGKATLRGLSGGWTLVRVQAAGYAPGEQVLQMPDKPGMVEKQTILLSAGAKVSGKVVDADGKPVADARIMPSSGSLWGSGFDADTAAVSDATGAWSVPAVGAGTWTFSATHEKFAPGTSDPVILDGRSPTTGVVIALQPAARLAGRVQSKAGKPVPFAAVRVGGRGNAGFGGGGFGRHAYCDDAGKFDMAGLPRRELDVLAVHDTGSSSLITVDLAAKPEQLDLVITLDLDDTITGIVVDATGEPIAEAQVTAVPEVSGGDAEMKELNLRGVASDVTNPGGEFTLTGLKKGKYRVRAARGDAGGMGRGDFWARPGVIADAGTTGLQIVLEADGIVKGKVLFADGTAPATFSIATAAYGTPTPFSGGGDFRLEGVPPGPRYLTISGPGFTKKVTDEIIVKPGEETDAGTITVEKGRAVRGKVVRADGTPVAGAKVYAGARLFGDGSGVDPGPLAEPMGIKHSTTDEDGAFAIPGMGLKAVLVLADHDAEGRSPTMSIPPGQEDVVVTLTLQPPGSVEGKIMAGGKPLGEAVVMAQPQAAGRSQFIAQTAQDGSYRFARLSPDRYLITAVRGQGMMSGDARSKEVVVKPGATAKVDLTLPASELKLSVGVALAAGGEPDNALIFMISGSINPTNLEQLENAIPQRGAGALYQGMIVKGGARAATFDNVEPGGYSICVTPFQGSITDPAVSERLQKDPDSLPVHCQAHKVTPSPREQQVTVTVP